MMLMEQQSNALPQPQPHRNPGMDETLASLASQLSGLAFVEEHSNPMAYFTPDYFVSGLEPDLTCSSSESSGDGSRARRRSLNTTECVPVPSSEHVAEIVGRQGCKVKALRAKTNTYIKTPVRGEEPVFIITGRREDVILARHEIMAAAEHFTQIRASRRHSQGGIPAPGQVTIYVRVPYKVVGLVVGPKGATIKRIQQQTHTYIITPSREREPIFEVTGLPENVEMAKNEIETHIATRTSGSVSSDSGADDREPIGPADFYMNGVDSSFHGDPLNSGGGLISKPVFTFSAGAAGQPWYAVNGTYYGCDPIRQYTPWSGGQAAVSQPIRIPPGDEYKRKVVQSALNSGLTNATSNNLLNINIAGSSDQDEGISLSAESLDVWGSTGVNSWLGSILSELDEPSNPPKASTGSGPASLTGSFLKPEESIWSNAGLENTAESLLGHAALLANEHAPAVRVNSAPVPGTIASKTSNNAVCQVCCTMPITTGLAPCGHRQFCLQCATRLCQMPKPVCPTCQGAISGTLRTGTIGTRPAN